MRTWGLDLFILYPEFVFANGPGGPGPGRLLQLFANDVISSSIFPQGYSLEENLSCECSTTGYAVYQGVHLDAASGDVEHYEVVSTSTKCATKCSNKSNCGGFSYVPEDQECILKRNDIDSAMLEEGTISGIKCDIDPHCSAAATTTSITPTSDPTGTDPPITNPPTGACNPWVVTANPRKSQNAYKYFTKYIHVLDCWSIFAEAGVSDEQVIYVAAMAAQLLDNDENGSVDDLALKSKSIQEDGKIALFAADGNAASNHWFNKGDGGAVLYASEINSSGIKWEDASLEEVLHNINHIQSSYLYSSQIGIEGSTSDLMVAMDIARGGHFQQVPNKYPAGAWYTYDDTTCEYECQLIEYLYWGVATYMGSFEDTSICNSLANEWKVCSANALQQTDVKLYAILTNPTLKLPLQLPNDKYCPDSTGKTKMTTITLMSDYKYKHMCDRIQLQGCFTITSNAIIYSILYILHFI